MDRLTFEGNFCDIAMCQENPCPYPEKCSQRKVWERLKAYEDTGLEPKEVLDFSKRTGVSAVAWFEKVYGITAGRMMELAQADKECRVVVLPCKAGAKIAIDGKEFYADHWNITLSCFADSAETRSGRQVRLLTREEAEAALKARG